MSEEFKEWFRANGRLDIDNYRDAMTHNLEIWEASRQQMLKEVLEVVESCGIQQAGGELDDAVCVYDLKDALRRKFGDDIQG